MVPRHAPGGRRARPGRPPRRSPSSPSCPRGPSARGSGRPCPGRRGRAIRRTRRSAGRPSPRRRRRTCRPGASPRAGTPRARCGASAACRPRARRRAPRRPACSPGTLTAGCAPEGSGVAFGRGTGFAMGTAVVTITRSSQTIGELEPRPGTATFHRTFRVSLHSTGGRACGASPVDSGPRHCGQKRSAGGAERRRARSRPTRRGAGSGRVWSSLPPGGNGTAAGDPRSRSPARRADRPIGCKPRRWQHLTHAAGTGGRTLTSYSSSRTGAPLQHEPDRRDTARSVRGREPPGGGRDGRGLPRARHAAAPPGGGEGPARLAGRRPRAHAPLRAGGPRRRLAQPPEHRRHPRHRPPVRRLALRRLRAAGGRDPAPADGRDGAARAQGDGLRDPDRARAGRGAREGDRPPRPEAGQHLPDPRRRGEDPRLRPGQVRARPLRGRAGGRALGGRHQRPAHRGRHRPGHRGLHGAGAGARRRRRPSLGHLLLRRAAVRDAHRPARLQGPLRGRDPERDPQGRAAADDGQQPHAAAGAGADRLPLPGEEPGRALPVRARPRLRHRGPLARRRDPAPAPPSPPASRGSARARR